MEGFKPAAKSISRFNFAARNLDRFFLTQLTEEDWKTTAEKLVSQMTDEVIDRAMAQQPHEIRSISAGKIAETLKPVVITWLLRLWSIIVSFRKP